MSESPGAAEPETRAGRLPRRAFLGLGTNLGDRRAYLEGALDSIRSERFGQAGELVAVSSVYETEPVGGPDQGAFLNLVIELSTTVGARDLLELCRSLEAEAERVRVERWGPRTLDVDVLWIDGETVAEPDLVVPHPRMFDRAFVMVPLAELAPELAVGWTDPDTGEVVNLGPL